MNSVLPLVLLFVAKSRVAQGVPPFGPFIVDGVAILVLAVSSVLAMRTLTSGVTTQKFLQGMVVALAFSEFASILAFALVGMYDWNSMILPVIGTLVVNLLVIAPRVAAYIRLQD